MKDWWIHSKLKEPWTAIFYLWKQWHVTSCFNPPVWTQTTVIEGCNILEVWPLETEYFKLVRDYSCHLLYILHLHTYPRLPRWPLEHSCFCFEVAQSHLLSRHIYWTLIQVWRQNSKSYKLAALAPYKQHGEVEDICFIKGYSAKIRF